MKTKHILAAREARLWLTGVIVPVAGIFIAVPEVREKVVKGANKVADGIKNKFKK